MPASIDHMTTNFDRIEAGRLDHKRSNPDEKAAAELRKIFRGAKAEVVKTVKAEAKEAKVAADLSDEATAQKVWDLTIARAVEAGVQTSIPGTRGNVFRAEARKAAKLAEATAAVEPDEDEPEADEEPAEAEPLEVDAE